MIGVPRFEPLISHFTIARHSVTLKYWSFVGIERQPPHAIQNGIDIFSSRARLIRVLDTEDKLPVVVARVKPAKQRRANAANMQDAGRTGRKTGSN